MLRNCASSILGVSDKSVSFGVDQRCSVFFCQRAGGQSVEKVKNGFAGAAKACAFRGANDGTIDQNRVFQHGVKQSVIVDIRIKQSQLFGRGFAGAQRRPRRQACRREKRQKLWACPAFMKVLDYGWRFARSFDDGNNIARGSAVGVVMNDDGHVWPFGEQMRELIKGWQALGLPPQQSSIKNPSKPWIPSKSAK